MWALYKPLWLHGRHIGLSGFYFVQAGVELSFPRFMHMMYVVLCECMPESRIPGKYNKLGLAKQERGAHDDRDKAGQAVGQQSSTWIFLLRALEVLEQDFARFDKSGDGYIDYVELTMGLPLCAANQRLNIMTRLEYKFKQVDLDKTKTVDFYEFIYLGFLMTQDGSYHDLVEESEGHDIVKKAFIEILSWYSQSATSNRQRLNIVDVQQFCLRHFHFLPERLEATFDEFSYTSSHLPGQKVIDFIRFLKLLAMLIVPDSKFHPGRYQPVKKASDDSKRIVKAHAATDTKRPHRIDPVVTSRFVRQKKVGAGGQGTVYSGYYDGVLCAGKVLVGELTEKRMLEVEREVMMLKSLDHPNCHFFIGAKTTIQEGGPLVLTELCEEGSLFDVYARKQRKLDAHTSWRIATECAEGCGYMHEVGYMHRDIKSLNILLTAKFVARVADFGMATNQASCVDAAGTVQWMAPEVRAAFLRGSSYPPPLSCYCAPLRSPQRGVLTIFWNFPLMLLYPSRRSGAGKLPGLQEEGSLRSTVRYIQLRRALVGDLPLSVSLRGHGAGPDADCVPGGLQRNSTADGPVCQPRGPRNHQRLLGIRCK